MLKKEFATFMAQQRSALTVAYLQHHGLKSLVTSSSLPQRPLGLSPQKRQINYNSPSFGQQNKAVDIDSKSDKSTAPAGIQFAHAKLGQFFQEEPRLKNQFTEDAFLQGYLQRHVPSKVKTCGPV